jgi:NAD(P)-dependent dehydrogenase (short-subunit alcohol dehydrogenase family)
VAVVGAGTMGAGIARVFADAGASVRLCARRESNLEAARARLGETAARVRLTTSAEEALDTAELVIETIVEEAEPKRALLARAEELASPEAILTTNTSSLPLAVLAGYSGGPSASPACIGSTRRSSSRSSRSSEASAPHPRRSRCWQAGWINSARSPSSSAAMSRVSSPTA